jgi:hypothetical protein
MVGIFTHCQISVYQIHCPTGNLEVDFFAHGVNSGRGRLRGVRLYILKDNILNLEYLKYGRGGPGRTANICEQILVGIFVHSLGVRGLILIRLVDVLCP